MAEKHPRFLRQRRYVDYEFGRRTCARGDAAAGGTIHPCTGRPMQSSARPAAECQTPIEKRVDSTMNASLGSGSDGRITLPDDIQSGLDTFIVTIKSRLLTAPPIEIEIPAGARHVLAYLGRYTHKTAIANHRLVGFDGEHVRFRWRDYADGNQVKVMRLGADEFIRRFLLHVLPHGFTRLRHYGLLANRCRARKLARCRDLLGQPAPEPREPETTQAMMVRLTWIDITVCQLCGKGTLRQTLIPKPQPEAARPAKRARPP